MGFELPGLDDASKEQIMLVPSKNIDIWPSYKACMRIFGNTFFAIIQSTLGQLS